MLSKGVGAVGSNQIPLLLGYLSKFCERWWNIYTLTSYSKLHIHLSAESCCSLSRTSFIRCSDSRGWKSCEGTCVVTRTRKNRASYTSMLQSRHASIGRQKDIAESDIRDSFVATASSTVCGHAMAIDTSSCFRFDHGWHSLWRYLWSERYR